MQFASALFAMCGLLLSTYQEPQLGTAAPLFTPPPAALIADHPNPAQTTRQQAKALLPPGGHTIALPPALLSNPWSR